MADFNGSLLPDTVTHFMQKTKGITRLEIGFHAHDNLGMAMAKCLSRKSQAQEISL
nr:hypothetical protein [Bartonella rattimassiliensis]